MLRFSKVLILSLLVVGLCAPMALATTSRVQALAGASQYLNDDSDIFRWYGTLPSYSKMVMAEAGAFSTGDGASSQALGFTHNWGEDHWLGTWGVFLLQNSVEDGSFFAYNPLPTPGFGPTVDQPVPSTKFALAWGKDLGKLALGFMFTRSQASFEPPVGDTVDNNFTTFGGGLRWDMNENMYGDGAVTFGFAGGEPVAGVSWDKKSSADIEARLFWEFMDNASLVPYFGYQMADYGLDEAAPSGDKWSQWNVGAAFDFDVNTNNLLIFAADVSGFNWKYSKGDGDNSEVSMFVFPKFYVALESDVTSWFTFRVGATKTMTKTTITVPTGEEYAFTYPIDVQAFFEGEGEVVQLGDFTWHLGGGFHVGEWDIDAVFSHELPFRLGYWLTGYGSQLDEELVSRVSATYRF